MTIVDDIVALWRRRYRSRGAAPPHGGLKPVSVITGASEGIGKAFAEALLARGDSVVLVARDDAKLGTVEAALGASGRVSRLALDVTEPDAAERIADHVSALGGYVDLLVNNAGIGLAGDFARHKRSDVDALLALNVTAATRLMHAQLPSMLARGSGGIINVASLGGYGPGPYQAAYYASKAYMISLTEAVAHEIRGQGVHVMAVAPGPVETNFHAKMGTDSALYRYLVPAVSSDHVVRSALRGFRFGRKVVLPGILSPPLMAIVRVTPHVVVLPLLGLILRPRGISGNDAR